MLPWWPGGSGWPSGLPFGPELLQELLTAREKASARQVEVRWLGHHGDLMPAVALAVWGSRRSLPKPSRLKSGP
jgi:hypothetical protein